MFPREVRPIVERNDRKKQLFSIKMILISILLRHNFDSFNEGSLKSTLEEIFIPLNGFQEFFLGSSMGKSVIV